MLADALHAWPPFIGTCDTSHPCCSPGLSEGWGGIYPRARVRVQKQQVLDTGIKETLQDGRGQLSVHVCSSQGMVTLRGVSVHQLAGQGGQKPDQGEQCVIPGQQGCREAGRVPCASLWGGAVAEEQSGAHGTAPSWAETPCLEVLRPAVFTVSKMTNFHVTFQCAPLPVTP